ncbi:MAG: LytTR family transcriptional regulator [Prevotella sp.]|nr:LytTR family transcriptional regulator [Prevotella sp.]
MSKNFILFNSRDEMLRLDVRQIVYFEADGNYTSIVLANKLRCSVGMNLGQMQKTLTDQLGDNARMFLRIGKRHIINIGFILLVNTLKQKLVLSDSKHFYLQLEVSKDALKRLKDMMAGTAS